MDASETTRLRALLERATPRPWHNGGLYGDVAGTVIEDDAGGNIALLSRRLSEGPASEDHESWANGEVIFAAVNALPALCDEVDRLRDELRDARADLDAQSFLRPHPSKRTGIRCARCGRDGGVDCGDDMPVCPWCSDAVTAEVEREACAGIADGIAKGAENALIGTPAHAAERINYLKGRRRGAELCAEAIRARGEGGR